MKWPSGDAPFPVVDVNGRETSREKQGLLDGLKQMRKVKRSGLIADRYLEIRRQACLHCPEQKLDRHGRTTGERLFIVHRSTPFCGTPWFGKLKGRSPWRDGCGCNLNEKIRYVDAECPRGRWGPGDRFGAGVVTVFDSSAQGEGRLADTVDVHLMSRDHQPDISGIGDTLGFLPIIREYDRVTPSRVRYVILKGGERWARLGYQDLAFEDDGERVPAETEIWVNRDRLSTIDQSCLDRGVTRHQNWAGELSIEYRPFRIEPEPGSLLEMKQRLAEPVIAGRPIVALSPFASTNLQRTWPRRHWLVLLGMLQDSGYYVYVMDGTDAGRTAPFNCEHVLGESPQRTVARFALTDLHVGNDSGMMHLSGLVGTPSVVVCGPTSGEQTYGSYASVETVQGEASCDACYWNRDRGFGVECNSGCINMWDIRPERVFEAIIERLNRESGEVYIGQEATV